VSPVSPVIYYFYQEEELEDKSMEREVGNRRTHQTHRTHPVFKPYSGSRRWAPTFSLPFPRPAFPFSANDRLAPPYHPNWATLH
jgi:hypothetical protein